jgi:hypothetical protein
MSVIDSPKVAGANGPLVAAVSRSTIGDGSAIVAGVANKQIRVVAFIVSAASGVVAYFKPSAGNWSEPVFGAIGMAAAPTSYFMLGENFQDGVLPDLPAGAGLMLNLDAAVSVTGTVIYRLIG